MTTLPPKSAQAIIQFFAGPEYEDIILGDLQERLHTVSSPKMWYWGQTLMSIPTLTIMHMRIWGPKNWIKQILFLMSLLSLFLIWELGVARAQSWAIARQILDYSPLSTGNTCRTVYICLYASLPFALGLGLTFYGKNLGKSPHFRTTQTLLLAAIASLPAIYLAVFPLPTDGSITFRFSQLILIWMLLICVLGHAKIGHVLKKTRFSYL